MSFLYLFLCVCVFVFLSSDRITVENLLTSLCVPLKVAFFYLEGLCWHMTICYVPLPSICMILTLNMCIKLHAVSEYIVRLTDKPLINLRYFVSCWLDYCKAHYIFVMPCPEIMQLLWWHLLRQSYDSLVIWAHERLSNKMTKVLYLKKDTQLLFK